MKRSIKKQMNYLKRKIIAPQIESFLAKENNHGIESNRELKCR